MFRQPRPLLPHCSLRRCPTSLIHIRSMPSLGHRHDHRHVFIPMVMGQGQGRMRHTQEMIEEMTEETEETEAEEAWEEETEEIETKALLR